MKKLLSRSAATTAFKMANNFGNGQSSCKMEGEATGDTQCKKGLGRSSTGTTPGVKYNQSGGKAPTMTEKARIPGGASDEEGEKGRGKGPRAKAQRLPGKGGVPTLLAGHSLYKGNKDDNNGNDNSKGKKRYLTEKRITKRKRWATGGSGSQKQGQRSRQLLCGHINRHGYVDDKGLAEMLALQAATQVPGKIANRLQQRTEHTIGDKGKT
jgi:hypothetical protein